jgi:hypothetical protein
MSTDDEAARKARAERLREEIDKLVSPEGKPEEETGQPEAPPAESPRDFIHRRMRELDQKKSSC